jgi:subtilisin family serine protease
LRGGLGAILVNAAGNAFEGFGEADDRQRCANANAYRVSCGDPAQDTRLGGVTPIIVGAINAEGKRSTYSTTGSSLWVSAPGGEYGFDSAYYDVSKLVPSAVKPAIVTTARSGCANRSNAPGVANALVTGNHRLALNCQYTAQMNGTSSAAPNTSATIALMLEANPRLSARDVKFILAKTAKQIDPGLASVTATNLVPGTTVTLEQGWVKNGAGHWFSNWYGFGAVDTSAAVAMAKGYTSYLPDMKTTDFYSTTPRAGVTVPAQSAGGLVIPATVNEPFTTVEQVVVFPNFEATPALSCNQIEVVSPSGTKSILLHAANGFAQTSVSGSRMLTNAFYGEPLNGTWKFSYFNFCTGQTRLSATQPQSFLFIGR